jgi:hypothetical protein
MDLKKAQRLLHKIEAFLDNGNAQDLSRLEKDLIKSYVIQLYDAVSGDVQPSMPEEEKPIQFVETKMSPREKSPKPDMPQAKDNETIRPAYTDHGITASKEKSMDTEVPIQTFQKTTPPAETLSSPYQVPEPVKEIVHSVKTNQTLPEMNEALVKLFDIIKTDELSGRISHIPIASIESAMGLNERIFTLNELFGGDKALFDATCHRLNQLSSFAEARTILMGGAALQFRWAEPDRIKMAEQFIRIVSRRYPKSVS